MSEAPAAFFIGDSIALARLAWVNETSRRLASMGYLDFRRSDTAALRRLRAGPAALGELAGALHVSRQAARKVVASLEQRGYVTLTRDRNDARRSHIVLTTAGVQYAIEVVRTAESLNEEVREMVDAEDLARATKVLKIVAARWPLDASS